MKTTGGKTKPASHGKRVVHIYEEGAARLIAVREAVSLKQALLDYFEATLRGYGYTKPKTTGNTLTVTNKQGKPQLYVALETFQTHVLRGA